MRSRLPAFGSFCALLLALGGCATEQGPVALATSTPALPGSIGRPLRPVAEVEQALDCIAASGAFRSIRIAVTPFADGTGKLNAVAQGATGAFLPQATTASFVASAIRRAGAKVYDFYSWAGEVRLRQITSPGAQAKLAAMSTANAPDLYANGSWLTLDFDGGPNVNAQFAGIGPIWNLSGATVSAGLDLVRAGTREILDQSVLWRTIHSDQFGISFGRYIGGVLATGEATYTQQDRLQLENTQYLVSLSVADAMSRYEKVPQACKSMVRTLLSDEIAPPPPPPQVVASR